MRLLSLVNITSEENNLFSYGITSIERMKRKRKKPDHASQLNNHKHLYTIHRMRTTTGIIIPILLHPENKNRKKYNHEEGKRGEEEKKKKNK